MKTITRLLRWTTINKKLFSIVKQEFDVHTGNCFNTYTFKFFLLNKELTVIFDENNLIINIPECSNEYNNKFKSIDRQIKEYYAKIYGI